MEEVSKSRERSISSQINCINSVRYDSAEQKILLSVVNPAVISRNSGGGGGDDTESFQRLKNGICPTRNLDSIFSKCKPHQIRKGKQDKHLFNNIHCVKLNIFINSNFIQTF